MKELNLHEEIIKSLKLISYDRSLTLNDQKINSVNEVDLTWEPQMRTDQEDREILKNRSIQKREKEIDTEILKGAQKGCNSLLNRTPKYDYQKKAKEIFLELRDEVGVQKEFEVTSPSTWLEPSAWGTSSPDLINALRKIKDKQTYNEIIKYIWMCYPKKHGAYGKQSNIIQFLQDEEYSKGQFLSKNYANGETNPMLSYQYYFNDQTLDTFEKILRKFNPDELYSKEYSLVSDNKYELAKGVLLPPLVKETLHVILPILSAIAVAVSGGAATILGRYALYGIIELADAMIYFSDNDKFMGGLSLFFAIVPAGKLLKLIPSLRSLMAKGGKKAIFLFLDKLIGKSEKPLTQVEKNVLRELSSSAVRGEMAATLIYVSTVNIIKKSIGGRVAYHFLRGIIFLVKTGYLGLEFLTNMGLFIYGGFWTWSKLAGALGLGEEVNKILKDKTIKPTEELLDDCTSIIYNNFKVYYNKGLQMSIGMKNTFKTEVFYLQRFLEKSKNNYITTPFSQMSPNMDEKNMVTYNMNGIKQKEGNKIFIFINERPNKGSVIDKVGKEVEIKNTSFDGKYIVKGVSYDKNNKVQGIYIQSKFKPKSGFDLSFKNKGQIKIKSFVKGLLGSNGQSIFDKKYTENNKLTFNDGYYGKNTFEAVKTYQIKNNLKPTGIVDTKTIEKMLSDLKSKKYGKIGISKSQSINLLKKMQEDLTSYKTTLPANIKEPAVDTVIVSQSQQYIDSIRNSLHNSYSVSDSVANEYIGYSLSDK